MNFGTTLFIVFNVIYFRSLLFRIFSKTKRALHKDVRNKLTSLRNKSFKTLDDQKDFLDLKYPKSVPKKFSLWGITKFIFRIALMIGIFYVIKYCWRIYIGVELPLWFAIAFIILVPVLVNKILQRFNLDDDDFTIFFK